jgi:hypothetical protein
MHRPDPRFEARRQKALALLAQSGMRQSNYLPLATLLLWKLGVQVPPPHFAGFAATTLVAGGSFGLVWGGLMWLVIWSPQGMGWRGALAIAAFAGLLFGLSMGAYYAYGRKRHRLPPWDSLPDEA